MGAKQKTESDKQIRFYNLKIKCDANIDPAFHLSEKVDGKWISSKTFNEIFGKLTKIEIVSSEINGATVKNFKFTLEDSDEISILTSGFNDVTYSILNSLSNSNYTSDKNISISIYKTKNEFKGTTYYNARASVKADGEKLEWAVQPKDFPKREAILDKNGNQITQNGKKLFDYNDIHNFWENLYKKDILPKLGSVDKPDSTVAETNDMSNVFGSDEEEDYLPF